MSVKVLDLAQGSDEWLEARRKYITASDMASILGINGAFRSKKKVLEEKVHGAPPLTEFEVALFARGHEVEKLLGPKMVEHFGMHLEPQVWVDEDLSIMASLDLYNAAFGVVVELKNTTSLPKIELAEKGIPWGPYRIQVITQMMLTNAKIGFLMMHNGNTGTIITVPIARCEKTEALIRAKSKAFIKELRSYDDTL